MSLYRVLYCSRNRIPPNEDAMAAHIEQILLTARRNNARRGITGGLLFSDGCFAQVLEGPASAIESVFERIQLDSRHDDVTVLQAGPVAQRDFPNWAMAFSGAAANHHLASMTLETAFAAQTESAKNVLTLLRSVVKHEREWLAAV